MNFVRPGWPDVRFVVSVHVHNYAGEHDHPRSLHLQYLSKGIWHVSCMVANIFSYWEIANIMPVFITFNTFSHNDFGFCLFSKLSQLNLSLFSLLSRPTQGFLRLIFAQALTTSVQCATLHDKYYQWNALAHIIFMIMMQKSTSHAQNKKKYSQILLQIGVKLSWCL